MGDETARQGTAGVTKAANVAQRSQPARRRNAAATMILLGIPVLSSYRATARFPSVLTAQASRDRYAHGPRPDPIAMQVQRPCPCRDMEIPSWAVCDLKSGAAVS
jgi:hypothetical protein